MAGARVPKFQDLIPQDTTSDMESGENFADTIKATPEADRRALVLARIRDHAGRVLGGGAGQVDVERPLAEMGLDSLMAVELAAAIERDLGQPVSVMQMLSAGNISAIADLVLKIVGFGSDSAT
jgi:phthiocerol/phenolphthiocerol synthesis type-I polyketide synthase C